MGFTRDFRRLSIEQAAVLESDFLRRKVSSAIVTEEWNYLLNPEHPDFKKLTFGKPVRYAFDRRLARARKS